MSNINRAVTNDLVIPSFETDLFAYHQDAQFAFGKIAVGNVVVPGLEDVYDNYLRLRGAVYSWQTNMISSDLVREDGSETDDDDARSVHIGIIENLRDTQRVVGSIRIIEKTPQFNAPLPIEDFFGDVFEDPEMMHGVDVSKSSPVEISRYICRHENTRVQNSLKWPLFKTVVSHIMDTGANPTFAVVEEFLEKDLQRNGVVINRIADPKFVPEYNDANLAVTIDVPDLAQKLGITPNANNDPYAPTISDIQFIDRRDESSDSKSRKLKKAV